jgi:hypothetical protein
MPVPSLQRMVAFNSQPGITYWVAPNKWSALTEAEFASSALGEEGAGGPAGGSGGDGASAGKDGAGRRGLRQGTPASVDWKAQGKVTPVKNQQDVSGWRRVEEAAASSAVLCCAVLCRMQAPCNRGTSMNARPLCYCLVVCLLRCLIIAVRQLLEPRCSGSPGEQAADPGWPSAGPF